MFTGLVEEIGKIINVKSCVTGKIFTIAADKIFEDLKIGDSVSVNGVCQTVTNINNKQFICENVHETLKKTTMKYFTKGQNVNLERAVTVNTRLGGHIVQGHIDTNGNIIQINNSNGKAEFYISFPCESIDLVGAVSFFIAYSDGLICLLFSSCAELLSS
ncbi:MAG: riboflavin synthase [Bacteroidetes bacterium]|nr:riboflavin synthase [Bacteroidota bacterium]